MFFAVNMLNNWAFSFNISVPVHIILRSFGSVTTMAAGWTRGKTYSRLQVISVLVLTIGVCVSAWADALSKVSLHPLPSCTFGSLIPFKGKSMSPKIDVQDTSFEVGLLVLLVAQILSAFMGIWVQDTYAEYGNHWDENLF
jgi:drug/metabolite transporter (DMT)-like permease